MKTWHLVAIGVVLLAAGIAGDVAIQRTDADDRALHVSHVDVKSDTVVFEGPSFPERALGLARRQHLALVAGAVAAWAPLAAAWRRRKRA